MLGILFFVFFTVEPRSPVPPSSLPWRSRRNTFDSSSPLQSSSVKATVSPSIPIPSRPFGNPRPQPRASQDLSVIQSFVSLSLENRSFFRGAEQPETVFPDEMSTTQSYNEKPLVETHRQGVDEGQLLESDGGKRDEFSMGAQGASFFDGGIQTSTPADDVFHASNRYRSGSENLRGDRARFDDWRSQGPYTAPQPRVSSPVGPAPGAPPQGGGFHTTTIAVTSTQRSSVSDLTRICAPVSPSSSNTSKLALEVRATKLN